MLNFDRTHLPHIVIAKFTQLSYQYRRNSISIYIDGFKDQDGAVRGVFLTLKSALDRNSRRKPRSFQQSCGPYIKPHYWLEALFSARCHLLGLQKRSGCYLQHYIHCNYIHCNYLIYFAGQAILDAIKEEIEITLFWIPSHSGIPGGRDC